jgi:phosphoglycerate dehydrogenase-like enzyme
MARVTVLEYVRDPAGTWVLPERHREGLRRDFPDVSFLHPVDRAGVDARLSEADAVLGYAVTPENLGRARRLRWIHITSAGVPEVLLFPGLVESPVLLTNGRGIFSAAMAEHALGLLLSFARKLHLSRDAQRDRRWDQRPLERTPPGLGTLAGTTLGLVGFGTVGRAIAERAVPLGMRVIAVRRRPATPPAPAHEQWGIERLHDLLEASDHVVLSPPLVRETRGMIGARELARMRPHAVLVNLGRGALIDEPALVEALGERRIAGAGLDVFVEEPLPAESPFWAMPHVIVTPHTSGFGPDLWDRTMAMYAENLKAFVAGRPLANLVDKRAGY